jgi:two-component system response regulator (stage 0 sporulation protein F)
MKPKLLVVDDEDNLRELYRLELEEEGYEIQGAANAKEALQLLSAGKYDVIILDIQMPGMFGIDLMQRILALDRRQAVILNTSHSIYQDDFLAWNADAYVMKSFDMGSLKRAIREVLAQHS